ncbi:MAG: YceH family protein [Tepidisphaerales bacterium]
MLQLTPDECRILGVLIEKELTVPGNYPLSLNALMDGSNQKNNREPLVQFNEDRVFHAVDQLRAQGLVVRIDQANSRVPKFKHQAPETLSLNRYELVILAELLLRGPQTAGEIRTRASRMHHLDTLEIVQQSLDGMAARPEPLVRQIPGGRAPRYVQLLCPDAHPIDATPSDSPAAAMPTTRSLTDRIDQLESQVRTLRDAVHKMAEALGERSVLEILDREVADQYPRSSP